MADEATSNAQSSSSAAAAADTSKTEKKKRPEQSCAFHELFSFADRWDLLLMAAGSLGALAHGAAMPAFFLLFGDLINGFGKNQLHLRRMTDEVSKVRHSIPQSLKSPFQISLNTMWLIWFGLIAVFSLLRLPRTGRLLLFLLR